MDVESPASVCHSEQQHVQRGIAEVLVMSNLCRRTHDRSMLYVYCDCFSSDVPTASVNAWRASVGLLQVPLVIGAHVIAELEHENRLCSNNNDWFAEIINILLAASNNTICFTRLGGPFEGQVAGSRLYRCCGAYSLQRDCVIPLLDRTLQHCRLSRTDTTAAPKHS
jgi:hypothetical protein